MSKRAKKSNLPSQILIALPVFVVLWVWFSALSFVPTPWPDDSAFYFVARELFKWPPRWVMLPQAPFEPTYRIFNFNTMPLYPILIGLGRWIGIDGSFWLKFWPLSAWALTGSLLSTVLYRKGLPFLASACIALGVTLDPELRWASVLVRPESLIGLFGMALVLGLTFGFPEKYQPKKFWDPIAALLALGAYAHFNAIHLVFPVIFALALQPKRLIQIGCKTLLYLSPWIITVLIQWRLFIKQMMTQWQRLAVPNDWLSSPSRALDSMFQALGSPEPWPDVIHWAALGIWALILATLLGTVFIPLIQAGIRWWLSRKVSRDDFKSIPYFLPALGWVCGSIWLFDSKPEVWFIYYLHISFWCLMGVVALAIWNAQLQRSWKTVLQIGFAAGLLPIVGIFVYVDVTQANRLGATQTWNWPTYNRFVDCIDQQLVQLEAQKKTAKPGLNEPFRVWGPTPPDVTIELSLRHPEWELTRTNDFMQPDRIRLAIQHGWDVDAVVVTETLNWPERNISSRPELHPEISSLWVNWKDYFLVRLYKSPGWKPNRFLCQRGRWQAFIFMNQFDTQH
jgi:hypothetical protein